MHAQDMTRRTFVGAAATLAMLLAGCSRDEQDVAADAPAGSAAGSGANDTEAGAAESAEDAASGDTADADSLAADAGAQTLVVYFSATGHTESVAQTIAAQLGAATFAITPAVPYTDADLNYNDASSRTSTERADARPELAQVTPDGWAGYRTVFVGYPIWWGEAAWPLRTFAEGNDFSGKTVVPFCTSASSGMGQSGEQLAGLAGSGEWREGARFAASASEDEIVSWLSEIGLA